MTTHDQNKKTLRHFQCRDYLWEIFEQMSAELECSTDYLINEAMRQYARSRNYGTSRRGAAPTNGPPPNSQQMNAAIPSLRENMPQGQRPAAPVPPPRPGRTLPANNAPGRGLPSSMPPPPRATATQPQMPQRPVSMPPPLPGPGRAMPGAQLNARPQL